MATTRRQKDTKLAQGRNHSSGSLPAGDGSHSTDQPEGKEQGQVTLLENGPKVQAKGTSCNSSWYFWPWTDPVEDNWHRVEVQTGSNAAA